MQIRILGARGEITISKPHYRKHAGILIDNAILLDAGEAGYLAFHPQCICITHLHPDHAFFVRENRKININVPVFAPEVSGKLSNINVLTAPVFQNGYKITPIPVVHSVKVKSQGYLIERNQKKIFYTGDMIEIEKKFHRRLHNLDAVITEASFFRKGGVVRRDSTGQKFGHTGIPDLIAFFKRYTRRIIFMHFGTWFLKDPTAAKTKIQSLEHYGVILEIGYDGKEFRV